MAKTLSQSKVRTVETEKPVKGKVEKPKLPSEKPQGVLKGEVISVTKVEDHEEALLWVTGKVSLGDVYRLIAEKK